MEKKILIAENANKAENEIRQIECNVLPQLQELIKVYAVLDLPTLDEDTALSLIRDKGTTVKEIFETAIVADLYASGQKNKNFVKMQIDLQQPLIDEFRKSVNKVFDQITVHFGYNYISYSTIKGYYLSEQSKEAIKESNKRYITNEKDLELYNAVKAVCSAIDLLNEITIQRTGYNHLETSKSLPFGKNRLQSEFQMLEKFISTKSDKIEVDAEKLVGYLKQYRQ